MKKIWQLVLVIFFLLAMVLGIVRWQSSAGVEQTSKTPQDLTAPKQ